MKPTINEEVENGNKANKFVHPKSRKHIAIQKKFKKQTKKEKAKQHNKFKQNLVAEKLLWIQKHMDSNICPYTIELTASLIEKYIARNDDELEQIQIKRSIGGKRNLQHANRIDAIRLTKERETEAYESCGLEIPDILDPVQCDMLKKWNGDLNFLPNFKFFYFNKLYSQKKLPLKQNSKKKLLKEKIDGSTNKSISESEDLKDNDKVINSIKESKDEMDMV